MEGLNYVSASRCHHFKFGDFISTSSTAWKDFNGYYDTQPKLFFCLWMGWHHRTSWLEQCKLRLMTPTSIIIQSVNLICLPVLVSCLNLEMRTVSSNPQSPFSTSASTRTFDNHIKPEGRPCSSQSVNLYLLFHVLSSGDAHGPVNQCI